MNDHPLRQPAVLAEVLYLLNLLLLPGIAFLLLVGLWWRTRALDGVFDRSHLDSALRGSLLAGMLIICVLAGLFFWGDAGNPYFWVTVVLYFTVVHTSLVLIGVMGVARALADKPFHFLQSGGRGHV